MCNCPGFHHGLSAGSAGSADSAAFSLSLATFRHSQTYKTIHEYSSSVKTVDDGEHDDDGDDRGNDQDSGGRIAQW